VWWWISGPAPTGPDEDAYPTGIVVAAGAAALVGTACLAALLPHVPAARLAPLVAVVAVVAAWSGNGRAAVTVAALAWPVGNGFLVNGYGTLSWHPAVDTWFVLALLLALSLGMILSGVRRSRVEYRRMRPFVALLSRPGADRAPSPERADAVTPD